MTGGPGGTGAETARRNGRGDGSWTVIELVRWSGDYLDGKGLERGRLDAEHLLAHALGVNRLQLYLQFDRPLTPDELQTFKPLLLRRAKREPLQYILGAVGFRELILEVDRRVLIPRPETEELVGVVLEWARSRVTAGPSRELTALDVGTGSGCIALSLAQEGPFARVVGTDPSAEALELAARNAHEVDEGGKVVFVRGSLFDAVEGERYDVVVSNPPYIPRGDAETLEPEVREWEPPVALFAGDDGLDVIRPLVREAAAHLTSGGLLALEVGLGQSEAVADLIVETACFGDPEVTLDLSRRPRVVTATRLPVKGG